MQIKSILAGAAIALVAGVGAASAVDFTTLAGIQAGPLSEVESARVRAAFHNIGITVITDQKGLTTNVDRLNDGAAVSISVTITLTPPGTPTVVGGFREIIPVGP